MTQEIQSQPEQRDEKMIMFMELVVSFNESCDKFAEGRELFSSIETVYKFLKEKKDPATFTDADRVKFAETVNSRNEMKSKVIANLKYQKETNDMIGQWLDRFIQAYESLDEATVMLAPKIIK